MGLKRFSNMAQIGFESGVVKNTGLYICIKELQIKNNHKNGKKKKKFVFLVSYKQKSI